MDVLLILVGRSTAATQQDGSFLLDGGGADGYGGVAQGSVDGWGQEKSGEGGEEEEVCIQVKMKRRREFW